MKNEKTQPETIKVVVNTSTRNTKGWATQPELITLKALQEKAKMIGKSYQYGCYQGL